MHHIILGAALLLTAPAHKTCPCSPACACGCNSGLPCRCGNPPVSPPPAAAPESAKPRVENFGVDVSKLGKGPRYIHNGREVTRGQALEAIEGKLPDDAQLPRLTVIGPEAERKAVLADIASHAALAPYKGRFVVQGYDPSHWAVQGFVTGGKPTIYVQRPDGKVLHRQDDYRGPEALAAALRKVDPSYDPAKDPDATRPKGLPFDAKDVPLWAWLAGAGAVLLILSRKDK
jgi:hypothetical protein